MGIYKSFCGEVKISHKKRGAVGSSFGSNNTSVGSDDAKAAILTIAAAILVAGLIHPYGIFSIIAHTVMDIRQPSQLANDSETNAFRVFPDSHSYSPFIV